ncbi:MAG: hypothetical protein AAF657_21625 [Acidobacteriota bacterium]
MKKKRTPKKLHLCKETLKSITELKDVNGAGSQNRLCAGYTVVIGPCIPTQGGAGCI